MQYEALKDLPPCIAVKFTTLQNKPNVFHELTGLPDRMISNMIRKDHRSLKVDTPAEFQTIEDYLLHRPMLFRCAVQHQITEGTVEYTLVRTWRAWYAVLIHPWHSTIQQFLRPLLTEASKHANAGDKFCLEIEFGKCVKDWFRRNVDDGSCCTEKKTTLTGMGICIYNYSTPLKVCSNPWIIGCCFPFWFLFGGPCYTVQRKIRFYDRKAKLRGISVSRLPGEAEKIHTITPRRRNTRAVVPINE